MIYDFVIYFVGNIINIRVRDCDWIFDFVFDLYG